VTRPRQTIVRAALLALGLAAPALAVTPGNDATSLGIDSPTLDVTRHAMPPPDVTAKPVPAAVSANPLWAVPLSALTGTRDRPLFSPSRRPPPPAIANAPVVAAPPPPPPPAALQRPNLVLVGTVAGGNESVAVFVDGATHNAVRLRTGEDHLGWVLQSVDRRTATLQKGDRSETLEMPKPAVSQESGAAATALPPPVVSALPPPPAPPPQGAGPAPASSLGGCMPEPIGC
jgi:hypothetical protein